MITKNKPNLFEIKSPNNFEFLPYNAIPWEKIRIRIDNEKNEAAAEIRTDIHLDK